MNKFPDDFLWGASTSPHQVEGDNVNNDWWKWEQSGGTEPSGKACDHYNRYKEDFGIAKELGHNAHRLGLEWSRLEKSDGKWDEQEWLHYTEVIDELLRLEIEPFVTLHHFTLPNWVAENGGWANEETIHKFSRFADEAVKRLGSRVRYWITINEPIVLAFIGCFQGNWPPFEKDFGRMLLATDNMLQAHVEAYVKMKKTSSTNINLNAPIIGLAKAIATFHPCSSLCLPDRIAAFLRHNFQDHSFIRSAIKGRAFFFPYIFKKLAAKNTLDFIGLNYYFREFVHHKHSILKNPFGYVCSKEHHLDAGTRTDMGWEIYPRGIYESVKTFKRYKLPIFITENGLGTTDDDLRIEYIKGHLQWLLKAVNEGVPINGYMHWSLLDNFEWAEGYKMKFGLVDVDLKTQERKIKESARYYAEVIRRGYV